MKSCDPWNEKDCVQREYPLELAFDDKFIKSSENSDKLYVPLEDSSEYLSRLEKKLSVIQGKTSSSQKQERKRIIDGLMQSREIHNKEFLRSTDSNEKTECYDGKESAAGNVDPQGTLGTVLRRLTPERMALSHEELLQLLESDVLAKATEEKILE